MGWKVCTLTSFKRLYAIFITKISLAVKVMASMIHKNLFNLSQISESVVAVLRTDAISYLLANVRDNNMLLKLTFSTLYNQV